MKKIANKMKLLKNPFFTFSFTLLTFLSAQNYSLEFDGVDDYVDLGNNPVFGLTEESSLSVMISIKPHSSGILISKYENFNASNSDYFISLTDDSYQITANGTNSAQFDGVEFNEWQNIVVVFDGVNGNYFYKNGLLLGNANLNYSDNISSVNLYVGTLFSQSPSYVNALIDDISIFNHALTQEEIQANMYAELTGDEEGLVGYWNFNAGSGDILYDHSGNGNHGTINGATWYRNFPITINVPVDFDTIQEAIDYSQSGDTILVTSGTYYENINYNGKNIALIGEARETTIIDGGQNGSVVTFESGETNLAILDGFTIKNGDGYSGGGVSIHSSSPKICNNIITENLGQWGGGIYCENSTANFSSNIISINNANYNGGGIFRDDDGSINIINCVLYGNNANSNGGGISTYSPDYIINTVIFNNSAPNSNNIHGSPNPIIKFSNIQYGYSPIGEGNIESDPLFTDPENGDFTLQSTSPCIDAGDPNSPLDPDGTIADIGAYYFSQITGCMDVNALNYNPEAHIEDNSCNYGINLSYGNNLISFAGHPIIDSTALLLESIESQGANVNFIIGQGVGLFKTDDGWSGNLNTVDEKSAYWLNVEGNLEWL